MTTISIRIPDGVIEDLKEIAPQLGFSGYQPPIRAYVRQGLRKDLGKFSQPEMTSVEESLRRHGVREETIATVLGEAANRRA
jgi:hypothetical protein